MNIKITFLHDNPGNYKTTFKEIGKENYYNRIEYGDSGCWYTAYPSNGYWENNSKVKDDIVFEVCDVDGNLLFNESNAIIGAFKSIGKKAKEISTEWFEKLALQSQEKWQKWLFDEMMVYEYTGSINKWLYSEPKPESETSEILYEYEHFGIKFSIFSINMFHPICGKKWTDVSIINKNTNRSVEICGYNFTD